MRSFSLLTALVLGLSAFVRAKSSQGDDVLVILDPKLNRDDYSLFFGGLEKDGYSLTFRAPKDVKPKIIKDDVPSFSHVILFTPETKGYASDITPQSLIHLLSLSTNLLITSSPKQTLLTALSSEFSLIPAPPSSPLLSHFPARSDPPTLLPIPVPDPIDPKSEYADHPLAIPPICSPHTKAVWYEGTAWALGNNPLLFPILRAPKESFVSDASGDEGAEGVVDAAEKGGEGLWAGSSLAVAAGFQTREGARVVWVGGVEVFSDRLAAKEIAPGVPSGNTRFTRDIAAWAFQESLVLRISHISHHLASSPPLVGSNTTNLPTQYTTNDKLTYTAHISIYNPSSSTWTPHVSLPSPQMAFTMLDPHILTTLSHSPSHAGTYTTTFRAPDRHGVFKFVLDYRRKGWTWLKSEEKVAVVPPRHDGYPRFLSAAWPYYAGAVSTSVGFVLFVVVWLSGEGRETRKKAE
ncbi:dolichyl-diphosphooligosaccharide-protein glycosyltransferase [Pterulicium gracile]|uniref:Dolichyl-diphosphooligosaccharide--protein glycosyltransferase subunit WBP1 n=1 Tax=Pterulicium gracile TaxID=1884261 RepID=A0A5C3QKR6_9AGAR|nr:dolichyl-diphosphooligosaccharide-protein glycosyltransferase [Pterula gracilis]